MTDKQIIIDGCDVQNCIFFKYCDTDVEFSECLAHWHPNEDYSNVYYAQCDAYPNCNYKNWQRKEQECEELKRLLKVRIEDLCDSCGASSMKLMPCKVYEKTLTEIKEIVGIGLVDGLQPEEYSGFLKILQAQILQKISECEVK